LVGWIGTAVGGVAAYRWFRQRPLPETEAASEPDGRAEELRAKLAETRSAEPAPAEAVAVDEPPSPPEQAEPESPEERRRRVHEEGRSALGEMQGE
jgi:hypothetical protein